MSWILFNSTSSVFGHFSTILYVLSPSEEKRLWFRFAECNRIQSEGKYVLLFFMGRITNTSSNSRSPSLLFIGSRWNRIRMLLVTSRLIDIKIHETGNVRFLSS